MTFGHAITTIRTPQHFESQYHEKIHRVLKSDPINRGPAHAMKDNSTSIVHELLHVVEHIEVDKYLSDWVDKVKPNLPWAEDHFMERIGGEPLNPSPSEAWWPYARKNNAEHKDEAQTFSHTYPERFWPKYAGGKKQAKNVPSGMEIPSPEFDEWLKNNSEPVLNRGIRFEYGDFDDIIRILKDNPMTRQAYLPIWFPEDLAAARQGQRVPCSMGYHFIYDPTHHALDCVYTMRSCDLVRFYRDDIYMAGRLLDLVAHQVGLQNGILVVNIANLHCFPDDRVYLEGLLPKTRATSDKRSGYNFGAMG